MKPIHFNCRDYTSPVEWCKDLIYEIHYHDVDVECIELYPIHENLDTQSILDEMSIDDLKEVVSMILNFYK